MGLLINPTHFFRKLPEQFRYERVNSVLKTVMMPPHTHPSDEVSVTDNRGHTTDTQPPATKSTSQKPV